MVSKMVSCLRFALKLSSFQVISFQQTHDLRPLWDMAVSESLRYVAWVDTWRAILAVLGCLAKIKRPLKVGVRWAMWVVGAFTAPERLPGVGRLGWLGKSGWVGVERAYCEVCKNFEWPPTTFLKAIFLVTCSRFVDLQEFQSSPRQNIE